MIQSGNWRGARDSAREFMTNKFIKQYNYAEMSVLNVKSIKVTNGENKDNIPLRL